MTVARTRQPLSALQRLHEVRPARLALGLAMAGAAAGLMWAMRGLTFTADELYAYARLVDGPAGPRPEPFGLEYLFAPHNGHFQVGGKVTYEGLFAVFGSAHWPFRVATVAGVLAGAGLLFELARRWVGPLVALATALLVLACGAAWEVMLWPYDLHTTYSLAFGLGALLVLERGGPRSDAIACALLVASVAMIELGLAFVVGVAALLVLSRGWRRLWVPAVPALIYLCWRIWSDKFGQRLGAGEIGDVPGSVFDSLTAVAASLSGLYERGPGTFPWLLDPLGGATAVAVVMGVVLITGLLRDHSPMAVALLGTLLVYWASIALGDRAEDSSRYMWAGVILVALLGAALARGPVLGSGRPAWPVAGGVLLVAVLAFTAGQQKLRDGRSFQLVDARAAGVQYAMLDLAGDRAPGNYAPAFDPLASRLAPPPFSGLTASQYQEGRDRIGSLGYSLAEVREQAADLRRAADAVLSRALGLELETASKPGVPSSCDVRRGTPAAPARFVLDAETLLRAPRERLRIGVGRFANDAPSREVGTLEPGEWSVLRVPADAAPDAWYGFAEGLVQVCRQA